MKKKMLALFLALLFLLCAGCGGAGGGKAQAVNGAVSEAQAPQASVAPAEGEDWNMDAGFDMSTSDSLAPGGEGSAEEPQKNIDLAEKIIYSADVTVETLEFDASVAALERMAAELGGFVESSQVSGNTRRQEDGTTRVVDRYAYYSIRVPSSRFLEALDRTGSLGSVTNSSKNAENITSQFTDQEARKHSLEVQEERLLSMLEKAEDVDTLVVLEARLSEVRYEIESIERTLRNWQNQVDYSTVSVSLQEVAVYTPTTPIQRTFGERLSSAFSNGWEDFVDFLQDFVLFLAGSLPALILLAIVVTAAVLLIRRARRRRAERRSGVAPKAGEKENEGP